MIHTISMHANKQIKELREKRTPEIFSHAAREYKMHYYAAATGTGNFLNLTFSVRHVFFD